MSHAAGRQPRSHPAPGPAAPGQATPGPAPGQAAPGPTTPGPAAPGHAGGRTERPGDLPAELAGILAQVMPAGQAFRHRQHIHLAFLAVQRYGAAQAAGVVASWIRHVAAYERAPQKFNATVTRAWTEMVAHHVVTGPPGADFDSFAERAPALLDKRLLARHYSARVLASAAARTGWVEPDLVPFPWPRAADPAPDAGAGR